jgi:hypothetical protein
MEVFCFKNLSTGLDHFVKTTGVKAEKLPSPEELQEIREEQDSLHMLSSFAVSQLSWLPVITSGANAGTIRNWMLYKDNETFVSATPTTLNQSRLISGVPADTDKPEK